MYIKIRKLILNLNESVDFDKFDFSSIAKYLLSKTFEQFKNNGFEKINSALNSLRVSSCLGNHEASFVLSLIYLHGIGTKSDQIMVVLI